MDKDRCADMRVILGYLQTVWNYLQAPKTRFEMKYYFIFLLFFLFVLFILWGGIYWYNGNF